MKKYFISFTYKKALPVTGNVTEQKITFEILDIDLSTHKGLSQKPDVSAVLFSMGYNDVNILHMNPL